MTKSSYLDYNNSKPKKMKFKNRQSELDYLEKVYKKPGAGFIVLYGRRRVGKTTLIKEFVSNKPHLYFLADKQLEVELMNRFKLELSQFLSQPELKDLEFKNWDALFNHLVSNLKKKKKAVLIIDEFQYLARSNPAFPSILQRIWDEKLKPAKIMMILSGSLINMMYSLTLSYKSPLYGRRTGQIKLEPIPFVKYSLFYPGLAFNKLVELYSITGGVPKYIESFPAGKDIMGSTRENIIDKGKYLYQEPRFILAEEISEAATYFSILRLIAVGNHKIGEIASALKIPPNMLTKYLEMLQDLGVVERKVPVTERSVEKSKRGRYFIKDNFFRFWFRFILPNQGHLEIENLKPVLEEIRRDFSQHVGLTYEDVCQELLVDFGRRGKIPFPIEKWGRWWSTEAEIDLVALNYSTHEILLGECKWRDKPVNVDILGELREKAKFVDWFKGKRKEHYIIFSKSGFVPRLKKLARKEKVILVHGDKIV